MLKPHEVGKLVEEWKNQGIIYPGALLGAELFVSVIGCEFDPLNPWSFLGPYMSIKTEIEDNGYFLTSCGTPKSHDLRILKLEEMADWCRKKNDSQRAKFYKNLNIMKKADSYSMDERSRKEHLFEAGRLARIMTQIGTIIDEKLN
jgi:hypothetical protein